jgi:D-glycero-alpha-D-manno-heptose-7-phosphate kinase
MISFWTGIFRPAESILAEQDKKNKVNAEVLVLMREQAAKMMDMICKDNFSVDGFGKIMDEGWQMKRKLASKISNSTIDKYYSIAMENGAIGGKLSGAGGGGFLNFIAHEADHVCINEALKAAGLIPCRFCLDSAGTTVRQLF